MLLTSSQLLLLLALIINEDEGSFFHNPKTAHTALKNKKLKLTIRLFAVDEVYKKGICNRLLLNILQVISQKYGLNL